MRLFTFALLAVTSLRAMAQPITTNNIQFVNPPSWLTETMITDSVSKIQNYLEWDLIRIRAFYHSDPKEYQAETELRFTTNAFFRRADQSIHLSPKVNSKNFNQVFGHELVHAIFFQKYKSAIPSWLEEGFANFIGTHSKPDYAWLSKQPAVDVTTLTHPQTDLSGSRFHYEASTALIEMIASRCSLKDLLQLSVGSRLQNYLKTYCEISDINLSYRRWIALKSRKMAILK